MKDDVKNVVSHTTKRVRECQSSLTERKFAKSEIGSNKSKIFLNVTPWNLVDGYQHFGGTRCHSTQGTRIVVLLP